jgi:hypothetical protein
MNLPKQIQTGTHSAAPDGIGGVKILKSITKRESKHQTIGAAIANRVWTPIGNATEAYRRRLIADPRAVYEHIWRLVHIEEALVVTIGSAVASRLMDRWRLDPLQKENLSLLRFLITGFRAATEPGQELESAEGGCWQGFIGGWTDLLNRFGAKESASGCAFCESVSDYLNAETSDQLAFLDAWQRIGPVPETFRTTRSRIGRIKAINSLRNKLAHVPISDRLLKDLHAGIRQEVLSLLTPDEKTVLSDPKVDPRTTNWHHVLLGRISNGQSFVTGSDFAREAEPTNMGVAFHWESQKIPSADSSLRWSAAPFLQLDDELKVLILFRVPGIEPDPDDEELTGEYHRFAAEIEPVQEIPIPIAFIRPWLPVPVATSVEIIKPEGLRITSAIGIPTVNIVPACDPLLSNSVNQSTSLLNLSPQELRAEAEYAYKGRDYDEATRVFDELAHRGDSSYYNHVARLRHGEVTWKSAERGSLSDTERITRIEKAVDLLKQAAEHSDVRYAAKARYQLSKAFWHLRRYRNDPNLLSEAITQAEKAASLAFEPQYISWVDRIRMANGA